jgi:Beta-propeller repeat
MKTTKIARTGLFFFTALLLWITVQPTILRAQVSDPRYVLGTYLGGSQSDYGRAVAVDQQGNIYLAIDSFSSTFGGLDVPRIGGRDILILKLNPGGGEILTGSLIGTTADDQVVGLTVTPQGEPVLSAISDGAWPLQNALNSEPIYGNNGVLAKFNTNLELVFSTYANMTMVTGGQNVALDAQGNIYLTGQRYNLSRRDLIVQKYNSNGQQLLYERIWEWSDDSTSEIGRGIAVQPDGTAAISGEVSGYDSTFPVTSDAAQKICGRELALGNAQDCDEDALIVLLNPDGTTRYASYLGGNGDDRGVDIALDSLGGAVLVGTTFANDFPTTAGALKTKCHAIQACYYDTFVARFDTNGKISYSTYLNSTDESALEFSAQVVAGANGSVTVLGYTSGQQFPIQQALQPALNAVPCIGSIFTRFCYDSFLTTFAPDGSVQFSSYLGGNGDDEPAALAYAPDGTLYLVGSTVSRDFPLTSNAQQRNLSGGSDVFLARMRLSGGGGNTPQLPYNVHLPLAQR